MPSSAGEEGYFLPQGRSDLAQQAVPILRVLSNARGSLNAPRGVHAYVSGYEKVGKGHVYFPLLAQSEYSNQSISKLVNGYFQGSFKSMVSFFMEKNDIKTSELEEILKEIEKNK